MKQRLLGRTGLPVSEIGFGCGSGAGLMIRGSKDLRRAVVARALELGIDYFDTAPLYGDGASESNLGETLAELGARPTIATKVILEQDDLNDIAAAVKRSVLASIARLRIDTVPVIQLHNRIGRNRAPKADVGSAPLLNLADVSGKNGVLEAFDWLRDRGLVRHFGCCAFGGGPEAVGELIDSDAFDVVLLSYSMLNRSAFAPGEAEGGLDFAGVGARAAARGMGSIALRALEAGKLTGSEFRLGPDASPQNQHIAELAREMCRRLERDGIAPAEAAIRFVLAEPRVATVLIGVSNLAQLDAAVAAANLGSIHW